MIEKPANQAIVRDEKGRFVPGVSGNPAGMPPGTLSFKGILRRRLEEHPEEADTIITALVKLGMDADLPSIKELKEWIDGKESDKLQMTGTMLVATPDQLDLAMRLMLENKASETKLLNLANRTDGSEPE